MSEWAGPAGKPFEKKTVDLKSGPVTYFVAGNGPPILYFHSAGGIRYTHALDMLSEQYSVYMMVSPGFENTPPHDGVDTMPALATLAGEFSRSLIGKQCDVIGQSFGGFLATWFTVLNGNEVGQLVLECPSGFRPKDIPQKPRGTAKEMKLRMFAHPERIPKGEKTAKQLAESRKWSDYYHKSIGLDEELVSRLTEIECLTLVLQGTKDGMMPPESGQLLRREIPNANLMYIYDAGHNIEVDQPKQFFTLVDDFFTRGRAFLVNPGDEFAGVESKDTSS